MDASRAEPSVASNGQTSAEPAAAFTPGPWVEFRDAYGETVAILPAGRMGEVFRFQGPYPRREDARLATAAPDLLAACRAAKREMWADARHSWTLSDFKNWAVIQQIDAAIAKAGGAS